ncbi:MAG: pilus assembly protein CpaB [Planctomycetota bacterium]|jgi:pilus assembly protein CpaB
MSKWALIIGIVSGLVAVILLNLYIGDLEQGSSYLRLSPTSNIVKGDVIDESMLETEAFPKEYQSLKDVFITPSDMSLILGQSVVEDITPGSLLKYSHFTESENNSFSMTIQLGFRAVSIPITEVTAVNFFIEPGSNVDLLGTFNYKRPAKKVSTETELPDSIARDIVSRMETSTILQNVKVLALGRSTTRQAYLKRRDSGFRTITFELSPSDAEKLDFARRQSKGPITLTLRNPQDTKEAQLDSANFESLLN